MRNASVSIAKGIAIILMVIAHARCALWWQYYINMFHMPLFFFMSGYCFREVHLDDTKGFVKKRLKSIWWPFVKWQLIFLLLHNVFFSLNIYNDEYGFQGVVSHEYTIEETVKKAIFITTLMSHGEQLLGGFWFLKSLLIGSFFFYFLMKIIQYVEEERIKSDIVVGVVLLIATMSFGYIGSIPLINVGTKDLMAGLFIWSGYMYNKEKFSFEKHWWFIVVAAVFVGFGTEFWQCSMLHFNDKFHLIFPYIVTALIGTLMAFGISERLASRYNCLKRFLVFVGDNTLNVLIWHFLSFKLVSLLLILIHNLPMARLAEFPVIEEFACRGWWVAYLMIGVALPLLLTIGKLKGETILKKSKI